MIYTITVIASGALVAAVWLAWFQGWKSGFKEADSIWKKALKKHSLIPRDFE